MSADLHKIETRFGFLDQHTQWALKGAHASGYPIEQADDRTVSLHFGLAPKPSWSNCMVYRLKPKPVRSIHSFTMGVSAYEHSAPIISEGHAHSEGWQSGIATVEMTDGKATRIVWEAAQ